MLPKLQTWKLLGHDFPLAVRAENKRGTKGKKSHILVSSPLATLEGNLQRVAHDPIYPPSDEFDWEVIRVANGISASERKKKS